MIETSAAKAMNQLDRFVKYLRLAAPLTCIFPSPDDTKNLAIANPVITTIEILMSSAIVFLVFAFIAMSPSYIPSASGLSFIRHIIYMHIVFFFI